MRNLLVCILLFINMGAVQAKPLSSSAVESLQIISNRKGLARLDYNKKKKQFELYSASYTSSLWRRITFKSRIDIMEPLEAFADEIEAGFTDSFKEDAGLFLSLRQAFTSLNSLYGYYMINPKKDSENNVFMTRFKVVLDKIKSVMQNVENDPQFKMRHLYKALPWEHARQGGTEEERHVLGLRYFDMPEGVMDRAMAAIGNTNISIRRAMEFVPTERKSFLKADLNEIYGKRLAIFVVHGTWAKGSKEYGDEEHAMFQQTKYTAQVAANHLQSHVELFEIEWSGSNNNDERMVAGEELAQLLNTFFPQQHYADLWVGHSHGGNVIFSAAKAMRGKRTPYAVVTAATPIRSDHISDNLNYLFGFYNTTDLVQYSGSYECTTRNSKGYVSDQNPRAVTKEDIARSGLFSDGETSDQLKIFNCEVLVNGKPPVGVLESHSQMKFVIGVLPVILDAIVTEYWPNRNLILNLDFDLGNPKTMTVRQMEKIQFEVMAAKTQSEPLRPSESRFDEDQRQFFWQEYGITPEVR